MKRQIRAGSFSLWRCTLLRRRGYLFSSMEAIFVLFIPVLPFLILAWLVLAVLYLKGKDREGAARWLLRLGIAIGVLSWLSWVGYDASRSDRVRPRVARAKSEIRNVAVNLETYYIDHNSYPPAVDLGGRIVPMPADGSGVSAGYVPWLLTTPVAYVSSLPADPFHRIKRGEYGPYRYATNGLFCWIMTSNGPDEMPDMRIEEYPAQGKGDCTWGRFVSHGGVGDAIEYDATNGLYSVGDVIRVGP